MNFCCLLSGKVHSSLLKCQSPRYQLWFLQEDKKEELPLVKHSIQIRQYSGHITAGIFHPCIDSFIQQIFSNVLSSVLVIGIEQWKGKNRQKKPKILILWNLNKGYNRVLSRSYIKVYICYRKRHMALHLKFSCACESPGDFITMQIVTVSLERGSEIVHG